MISFICLPWSSVAQIKQGEEDSEALGDRGCLFFFPFPLCFLFRSTITPSCGTAVLEDFYLGKDRAIIVLVGGAGVFSTGTFIPVPPLS